MVLGAPALISAGCATAPDPATTRQIAETMVSEDFTAPTPALLKRLQQAVIDNKNVFEVLIDAVRCCSLGQITGALFEVGGQYRRSM